MENNNKEKNNKVLAVAALLVAIVGLSIGFAAYSGTLTIKSGATVTPDKDTFSIDFTNTPDGVDPDPIIPEVYPEGVKADPAIIDNTDNPTVSGLKAYFTAPGQKVSYTLYAYNNGQYSTYLKNILFKNVSGATSSRVCTPGTGASDALVQTACDDIVLSVKVGNEAAVTGTKDNITNHALVKDSSEQIIVTIEYLANGDLSDGPFDVQFGDVTLEYRSAD